MRQSPDNLITVEPRLLRFARPQAAKPAAGGAPDVDVEAVQKALMTRYVMPVVSAMSALFFASYMRFERNSLLVFVFYLVVTAANVFLSSANRRLKLGQIELWSRSDGVDAVRWLFNLVVADAILTVALRPSAPAFVGAWTILILAAQADMCRRRYRVPVALAGMATAAVLMIRLYPGLTATESLLVLVCIGGASVMIGMAETFWLNELARRLESRHRETAARYEARQLKQEALVGGHVRTLAHELANLLSILDLASSMDEHGIQGEELAMVRRSVDYAKRLNGLLLRDMRSTDVVRTLAVHELVEDVELLLGKEVMRRGHKWRVDVDREARAAQFRERGGSVYFIIHNLVKNAWEALASQERQQHADPGCIALEFSVLGRSLVVSIRDDANGMSESQRQAILSGKSETTKDDGHGLGLRFVVDECRRNQFQFSIETKSGHGTCFQIVIPRAD